MEKDFIEAAKALTETNSNLTEIDSDLKAMKRDLSEFESKLLRAAKSSDDTLKKYALKK